METSLAYIIFHLRKLLGLDSLRNWRERRKMRWAMDEAEKCVVSTALRFMFTGLVSEGRLSRETADEYLRKFARNGLPDLLPPPDADVVKDQINGRMEATQKGDKHRKTKLTIVEVQTKPKLTIAG